MLRGCWVWVLGVEQCPPQGVPIPDLSCTSSFPTLLPKGCSPLRVSRGGGADAQLRGQGDTSLPPPDTRLPAQPVPPWAGRGDLTSGVGGHVSHFLEGIQEGNCGQHRGPGVEKGSKEGAQEVLGTLGCTHGEGDLTVCVCVCANLPTPTHP